MYFLNSQEHIHNWLVYMNKYVEPIVSIDK